MTGDLQSNTSRFCYVWGCLSQERVNVGMQSIYTAIAN